MSFIPVLTAVIVSALLGYFWADGNLTFSLFIITGLISGFLSRVQPNGSERFYWGFVVVTIVLTFATFIGISIHRYAFILPLIFAISYFFARLTRKFSGQTQT